MVEELLADCVEVFLEGVVVGLFVGLVVTSFFQVLFELGVLGDEIELVVVQIAAFVAELLEGFLASLGASSEIHYGRLLSTFLNEQTLLTGLRLFQQPFKFFDCVNLGDVSVIERG